MDCARSVIYCVCVFQTSWRWGRSRSWWHSIAGLKASLRSASCIRPPRQQQRPRCSDRDPQPNSRFNRRRRNGVRGTTNKPAIREVPPTLSVPAAISTEMGPESGSHDLCVNWPEMRAKNVFVCKYLLLFSQTPWLKVELLETASYFLFGSLWTSCLNSTTGEILGHSDCVRGNGGVKSTWLIQEVVASLQNKTPTCTTEFSLNQTTCDKCHMTQSVKDSVIIILQDYN